eukprot:6243766-Pyramimonas_sp.AAC.1
MIYGTPGRSMQYLFQRSCACGAPGALGQIVKMPRITAARFLTSNSIRAPPERRRSMRFMPCTSAQ